MAAPRTGPGASVGNSPSVGALACVYRSNLRDLAQVPSRGGPPPSVETTSVSTEDSTRSYRGLTIRGKNGACTMTPFAIAWDRYSDSKRNRSLA